jgi:hypothetical protein
VQGVGLSTVSRLAIFDIDGTLTDTNGVDDESYRVAVAAAIGVDGRLGSIGATQTSRGWAYDRGLGSCVR